MTLIFEANGRRPQLFWEMEDDLKFWENGRRPQFLGKWKTTSFFFKARLPQFFLK